MNLESRQNTMPDVAHDAAAHARGLDWVGMEGIALPLQLDGGVRTPALADVFVNLKDANARGIHMSRLFLRLQETLQNETLTTPKLHALLQDCIDSQNGLADAARVRLKFAALLERPALASANSGWREYPVEVDAELGPDGFRCAFTIELQYSSTCPASAALSRQVISERFLQTFPNGGDAMDIAAWLASPPGMAATPHAQRSVTRIRIGLAEVVDAVEKALGTPVQTAVKREDERAFAEANAANLMFCEDAARRIAGVLAGTPLMASWRVEVRHLESLHAHDAVAFASGHRG